jgi:hypothetical protein
MVAVRTECEGAGYRVTHTFEELLPFAPFSKPAPSNEDCACLFQAMQRVAISIPQTYWPLQIALPDPAAIIQIMEFEELPGTKQERTAIARFRFEKEIPTMTQMQCTTQDISKQGERSMLLAIFIQRAWLDCLNKACRAAGLLPSVIDASINYLFNRFYDVFGAVPGEGVLISIDPGTWSILFWDNDQRPRFVRSRWRDTSIGKDDDHEEIVRDIERLIVSYVLRLPGRRISGIYLCASDGDRVSMVALLEKRMRMPCVQLDLDENFSAMTGLSMRMIPSNVLAAAVPRI